MDYKAGMFVYAFAFLLGTVMVQQMSVLPATYHLLLLLSIVSLSYLIHTWLYKKKPHDLYVDTTLIMRFILLISIGIIYSSFYAKQQLSMRFDEALIGKNIIVSGKVISIPVSDGKVQRFELDVEGHRLLTVNSARQSSGFPDKIRLSWYYGEAVNAGETWQLEVRLKPPHGFMNPGGLDYEGWLFQHGIQATGYVRKSSFNKREQGERFSIDKVRQSISRQVDSLQVKRDADTSWPALAELKAFSLLKALAVGDKSSISNHQWRVLANTGTSHLMAISGLHIGLASLFAYVLIRRSVPVVIMKHIPAQHVALVGGIVVAFCYALIAGMSVSTQRAIIMLFVLSVMMLIRRNHRPIDALGFAVLTVLLFDPLAVLSAGFWFSFSAVAVIFISLHSAGHQHLGGEKPSISYRLIMILKRWVRLQLLISLFMLPLSLFMFQQVSLVAPIANLLLIPYVSFFVVPVVLMAIIFSYLFPAIADLLFILAAYLLDLVWPILSFLSSLPFSLWVKGDVGIFGLLLATAATLLLFYSNRICKYLTSLLRTQDQIFLQWLFRFIVCLLFIPLLLPARQNFEAGEYQLTVLDVGQGSAAVIKTQNHVAVFDAGASFSDRFNAGSGVIIPYLRTLGVRNLDRLIISHGDADHIGGAQALIDEYPETFVLGQDIDDLKVQNKQLCSQEVSWRWDGIDFVFLSPPYDKTSKPETGKRNDRSCVLQVSSPSGSVLFTGDIEKKAENRLLDKYGSQLASDILIVPHHGSSTSSSAPFIEAVSPVLSIISAGYKNRYRLPSSKVIQRYEALDIEYLRTDKTGAIMIKVTEDADRDIEKYREIAAKYWHHISDF